MLRIFLGFLLFSTPLALRAESGDGGVPPRPLGHIVDTASALPLQLSKTLDRVLSQHETLSHETVYVVISGLEKENEEERAAALFESWKRDAVDPTKAVLILFQMRSRKVALRAGVGMEAFLVQFPLEKVTQRIFRAEIAHGSVERGVVLSVLELLDVLEDPHLEEARQQLRETGFHGEFLPRKVKARLPLWPFMFVAGLLGFIYVLYVALTGEAHYSSLGWMRVRHLVPTSLKRILKRMRKRNAPALVTGGGVSGTY